MDLEARKDRLIEAILPHAAFDGWSRLSLLAAAEDLGLEPGEAEGLFPGGAAAMVAHFVALADRRLVADLAAQGLGAASVGERIFQAVCLRLSRWSDHREAVRRAASVLSLPLNLPLAARLTWNTADAIWLAIGDTSHDFAWYTKRATLAAVYSATLLYWLDDGSEACADSWAFLRRRLADMRNLPKLRQRLEGMVKGGELAAMARRLKAPARRWGMPVR